MKDCSIHEGNTRSNNAECEECVEALESKKLEERFDEAYKKAKGVENIVGDLIMLTFIKTELEKALDEIAEEFNGGGLNAGHRMMDKINQIKKQL